MSTTQPNATLYVHNLNDKVNKQELRTQLYALFTTYGRVIDIVAMKGAKMRGQAFLVFDDLAGATTAMRACEGTVFYDKPMRIEYAKNKSYATLQREDPNFIPPEAVQAKILPVTNGRQANGTAGEKRSREEEMGEDGRGTKREKNDYEDDEEMEIEDDEEGAKQASADVDGVMPTVVQYQSARLLCTNLPQEVTDDVLSVLFQQYQGFQSTHVAQSPTPNAAGQKVKMAQVLFDSSELASVAKEALDGFALKKGWVMSVAYI
ncbi:RNA-binding domain-containing protein [Laetiporus sulphureus 93-53]|uniref:RNA-binding domain-containing protein n=1 Tax=Laetiporus sulphureus 93-53 TaxID=1314785 RepID=A0A165IHD2_9APHY|nr:RNA-binding domain-containing protein [Laetiporus sulphureus 93-53]KZT13073.1 RNA-binding domain-containing protein [Laetiporus sulphureus 93-53]